MTLDELINKTKEKDNKKSGGNTELTGLSALISKQEIYNKLGDSGLCPNCGSSEVEKVHYYWRCNNNSCDCITYSSTDYAVDITKY